MCIFVQEVKHVAATKIFVAPLPDGRQITIYMNSASTAVPNAMILPVPTGQPITLLDCSKLSSLFKTLESVFPTYEEEDGEDCCSEDDLLDNALKVFRVGDYDVSLAATLGDLQRIDASIFKVADGIEHLLSHRYGNGYSFVVCKMINGSVGDSPVGYISAPAKPGKLLFVPTVHGHDGSGGEDVDDWDHQIFSVGCKLNNEGHDFDNAGESVSERIVRMAIMAREFNSKEINQDFMEASVHLGEAWIDGNLISATAALASALASISKVTSAVDNITIDSTTGEQVAPATTEMGVWGMASLRELVIHGWHPNKDHFFAVHDVDQKEDAKTTSTSAGAQKDYTLINPSELSIVDVTSIYDKRFPVSAVLTNVSDTIGNYWLSKDWDPELPQSFTVDLGQYRNVVDFNIINTRNRQYGDRGTKYYEIGISENKNGPWTKITRGKLLHDATKIQKPSKTESGYGRYIKFNVLSQHGSNGVGLQYLGIFEKQNVSSNSVNLKTKCCSCDLQ